MALKDILDTYKKSGYIVKDLDQYLIMSSGKDMDRKWGINSPSSAGGCIRESYYKRLNYEPDSAVTQPRLTRIFNNGDGVHERLQNYLKKQGMLLMDEIPVYIDELQVQGHTDGLLDIGNNELAILEIKSINDMGFSKLQEAREDHTQQGLTYLVAVEDRRKYLRDNFKTQDEFENYLASDIYENEVLSKHGHLKGGRKYSKEQKLMFKKEQHLQLDIILWNMPTPVTKVIFLYENKNNQELKEFTFKFNENDWEDLKNKFEEINYYVGNKELPPRPKDATAINCSHCRWCNYKTECFY